jgi:NAD(P)H-dependent FMN reductase
MKLGIIIGATRQGRQSQKQAQWVYNTAIELEEVEAEIVDLKDYPMPFFDEPISPRYNPNREIDLRAQRWLKKLEEFDAYVFVTPEYNHSIPGVLKNAIDYITWEMSRKPAAIVSHGSAGGARAAMHLKEILSESKTVPIPNSVAIHGMSEAINEEGELAKDVKSNPYGPQSALDGLLEELQWYSDALQQARKSQDLVPA